MGRRDSGAHWHDAADDDRGYDPRGGYDSADGNDSAYRDNSGYGYDQADRRGAAEPRRRRARRRRRLLTAVSSIMAIVGVGLVGAAVYVNSIAVADMLTLPETTTVYYSDGKTVLARLGSMNRTNLAFDVLPDSVTEAAVAADDPDFWTGDVTAITRSVARHAFELDGDGVANKARVTVLAWKLDDAYSKADILTYYLNAVAFGRGTYGIEAAAQEFFGKSASRTAPPATQLTLAEAMVLIAMIKHPWPDPDDPENSPGFDPTLNAKAMENSKARWTEIRASMVGLKYLTQSQADALAYPTTVRVEDPNKGPAGLAGPSGLIVNHVLSELAATPSFKGRSWTAIREGGYEIVTTIDARAQSLLEKAADETVAGSAMFGQPENLQAAAVAVEPRTGRVLAYFGGHSGTGADFAGFYFDEARDANGYGAHPPGGTFHVHALAAALRAGVSVKSRWNTKSPQNFPTQQGTHTVRDVGRCPTGKTVCTLADATVASLDTAYFGLTVKITPAAVISAARDAGIDFMWTDERLRQDLHSVDDLAQITPSKFDTVVGIGQYAVTVLDQANAMATYAAVGLRAHAHFLRQVRDGEKVLYSESMPTGGEPRILQPAQVADLTWALSHTPAGTLKGRDSATKTGVWQLTKDPSQNAHAWMVGYTSSLALTVWVGNDKEEQALKLKTGETVSGGGLPATIYRTFMTAAHDAMRLMPKKFGPPAYVGDEQAGNAPS